MLRRTAHDRFRLLSQVVCHIASCVEFCVATRGDIAHAQFGGRPQAGQSCKGDHKHMGSMELPYRFVGIEELIADFLQDVGART